MARSSLSTNELNKNEISLINGSTDIYDKFDPIIKAKVKNPQTFQRILQIMREFMSKNEHALATNIVGRRVLVNQKMEDDIYSALGVDKDDIKKIILSSGYFKGTFGRELSLTDQFCLAFPLILASLEYKLLKKQDESDLCYLMAHFKPYSSRESFLFKYPVKEGQMMYTIEKSLSERYDIKKYGTIISAIQKRAKSSYDNYILPMEANDKYNDKRLYVTYTSGIAGNVNNFIGGIYEEYMKNAGKSLDFEAGVKGYLDKDSDQTEYEDADIQSDTAMKKNIVDKAMMAVTKTPVNTKIAAIAAQFGFNSSSTSYYQILVNAIEEITDKMFDELPIFFTTLMSAFLFYDKPGGGKYSMQEFRSPVFLNVGIDILAGKKSNVKYPNLIKCREIIKKMCEEHCTKYNEMWGDTYKAYFRKALAAYWIYLIKLSNGG